ncbi:MAG: adenylate/guanylate cyclase domain-containing protein [Planctomycetota bacterium]
MSEQNQGREMLALLFTDLVGSTQLKSQIGGEVYARKVLDPHNRLFREIPQAIPGARVLGFTGDGFFAAFRVVADGVKMALLFQQALREYPWESVAPLTRSGIHVGEVVPVEAVVPGQTAVVGQAADVCARLMGLAGAQSQDEGGPCLQISSPS